jgi:lipoprotein-releasing system permease protein
MKLAFSIAKRFLTSAKKQTIVIILGIAVGVSVQVFIGALMNGLQDNLIDTAIGSQSQITLSQEVETDLIDDYQSITDDLDNINELSVVSPAINSSGQLSNSALNENVIIKGVDFTRANDIYQYDSRLVGDNSRLPNNNNEIVLGIGLKESLNINIGDTISYIDNTRPSQPATSLTVVGFVDYKVLNLNNSLIVSELDTIQDILGYTSNQVQTIEMQINDVFAAEEISEDILNTLADNDLKTVTWIEQNQDLLTGLEGQSISSLMIQIFVIISVVLGISSVLAITVLQKSKQLGILKAMGIKDKDASKIFLFEGLLLGVFGAIIGIGLGIGLLYAFDVFADTGIPITFDLPFLALSAGIAILASTLAALSPAIKSSKLSVIEVIRNG